ncbi:sodium- and chloride-dependent glycine transporter 2-like [Elysia marginata]|uniref:Sodium- and chloride-dependent glycine transporter 2-like n=1 Tax=Elysia marginata TaxID=1093978 RepID=A0AAV4IMR2_9GAST|nr:sodium- and chloride-dependent glycine transporter 2-like [Elysia marginata]
MSCQQTRSEERASWGRHLEFFITCIGFAVGLGNVWRFPHLMYSYGGGAFFIPYIISLVFMGIPLFCLEILFGQFASKGPITIWENNPLFKGLGYTMVALAAIISVYYNIVVATAIYFLFASMQSEVPWASCGNDWNTCACRTYDMNVTLVDPLMWYNSTGLNCSKWSETFALKLLFKERSGGKVLEATDGIDEPGKLKWDLTLCNLLAWVIIAVALIKGVKTMGKAVYFFAIFPYILLTVLVVRGVTLDGAKDGLKFYLEPDLDKLSDSKVWKAAASQIFFSLSCCTGSLTAMSSYTKFKNNFIRDSMIIPIINCCTSFYAGFAIFSVLGFMSQNTGVAVENVTTDGPGLIFVAYPEALYQLPVPQLWSILFFFMVICLGMGTQFPSVETVMTGLQDEFPVLRGRRTNVVFRLLVCVAGFLLGLPQTTQGGSYLLDLCDFFVGWPLLLIGFLEVVGIIWIYGEFGAKQETQQHSCLHHSGFVLFFNIFFMLLLTKINTENKNGTENKGNEGEGKKEKRQINRKNWRRTLFVKMNQPTKKWGPADPANRTIPRYQHSGPDQVPHISPVQLENQDIGGSNTSLPPPYPGYEEAPPKLQEKNKQGFDNIGLEIERTKF